MKSWVWVWVWVLIGLADGVQARTWTNADGKTLEAELVRVTDDTVFLKLDKNRQTHPFEIEKLSPADQTFIDNYRQELAEKLKQQALKERRAKWLDDLDEAKMEAAEYDLPILLLYTAPEWCGYCVLLEDNILSKREFKEYANENLVLLMVDFSNREEGQKWLTGHPSIHASCPAKGYPCSYLLSTEGESLGRIGYYEQKWSPQDYVDLVEGRKNAPPATGTKKKVGKKRKK